MSANLQELVEVFGVKTLNDFLGVDFYKEDNKTCLFVTAKLDGFGIVTFLKMTLSQSGDGCTVTILPNGIEQCNFPEICNSFWIKCVLVDKQELTMEDFSEPTFEYILNVAGDHRKFQPLSIDSANLRPNFAIQVTPLHNDRSPIINGPEGCMMHLLENIVS